MNRFTLISVLSAAALVAQTEHPTGNRTTPPTIRDVQPRGIARGTTVEMTVEGFNLAKASAIYFDRAGLKGKVVRIKELPDLPDVRLGSNGTPSTIDLGPLPPRNQVTVEVEVNAEADIGPVNFRLLTPLGTSPEGRFLIEPYYGEAPDREPNNTLEGAFDTYLPAILVGEISRPGDIDLFKIKVHAGEELVFDQGGAMTGSTLQPVVSILRDDQSVVKEFGLDGGISATRFSHKFDKAGTYYIRIADYQQSGRAGHTYRLKVGNFPLATGVFPLGIQRGKTAEIEVEGLDLAEKRLKVKGEPTQGEEDVAVLRPVSAGDRSFSEVKVALGTDAEVLSTNTNTALARAQVVSLPVTINGRVAAPKGNLPTENYFRFHATKGQKLIAEVQARRLGSELDSMIEILDAKGKPIEIATLRSVLETAVTLRDHDSAARGIRLASYTALEAGDYLLIGTELTRIDAMPLQPDADALMETIGGQRVAYLGTSPEAHALDQPVYKVQIHPPGSQFAPNGLPLVRLYARNDDGAGIGKDSYLEFTAPADGEYVLRLRDVRGLGGDDYAYRLNIRQPRPDFRLSVSPRNPNVPAGGTIPLTVTAVRMDGYDGPIDLSLEGLPQGFTATNGVIKPGQVSATILLSATPSAKIDGAFELKVKGTGSAAGSSLVRYANPNDRLKLVALMPQPDVVMHAKTREVVLELGETVDVNVAIERQNGFGGRVPVEVRNLPPRVRIVNTGLNGVLINEDEKERSFTLEALPSAVPGEQMIYVSARVETRSNLDSSYAAPEAIRLRIIQKRAANQGKQDAVNSSAAAR